MAASKYFLLDYLLKKSSPGEKHYLQGVSLENVMDRFATLSPSNCRNFVVEARRFVCSGMNTINSIVALNDNSNFKYIHYNWFPGQSINKVFVFKISIDLACSGIDFVQWMQVGRDIEHLQIMFNYMKWVKDWTTIACHIYESKYCKVLSIACCDM
jgi:hypothetical protein